MAVLMSYHKLVERDSSNVDYHWKSTFYRLKKINRFCFNLNI